MTQIDMHVSRYHFSAGNLQVLIVSHLCYTNLRGSVPV